MTTMTVGVIREGAVGERRVALTPDGVTRLQRLGLAVLVEKGAGASAWFPDAAYAACGAQLVCREDLYLQADVVLCVHPPVDVCRLHDGQALIGLLQPLYDPGFVAAMRRRMPPAARPAVDVNKAILGSMAVMVAAIVTAGVLIKARMRRTPLG